MNTSQILPAQKNNERGTIVVIVLLVLAILSFLAMELSKETLVDYSGSVYMKSAITGNSLLDSGRLLAKETLSNDLAESKADYRFESWGYFGEGLKEVSEELSSGYLSGDINDENALFPINQLKITDPQNSELTKEYQELFLRILKTLCADLELKTGKPEDYLNSIRIWQGEELSNSSADDDWYKSQTTEYQCPKRALISPDELLLIRWPNAKEGDVEKLYYGTETQLGLRDIITVWGSGPINMNTAHDAIIKALPTDGKKKEEYLTAANQYRSDPSNNFEEAWYITLASFQGISENNIPQKVLSFKTDTFRVNLKATVGSGEKREIVIFRREKEKVKTLSSVGE